MLFGERDKAGEATPRIRGSHCGHLACLAASPAGRTDQAGDPPATITSQARYSAWPGFDDLVLALPDGLGADHRGCLPLPASARGGTPWRFPLPASARGARDGPELPKPRSGARWSITASHSLAIAGSREYGCLSLVPQSSAVTSTNATLSAHSIHLLDLDRELVSSRGFDNMSVKYRHRSNT